MLYKIFAVLTAMRFVTYGVMAQPPTWKTPANGSTITLDATVNTACDNVATINAESGDGTTVTYSVSQTPLGGFSVVYDGNTGDYKLTCTLATIKASSATSYSVTVRASNSGQNSDITITISVTGLSPPNANAPVFSGTPYNLKVCRDKIDCRDDIILPFVLLAVSVSDADNNTVTLSLPDADPTIFTVESYSIKVKRSLLSLPSPYQLKVVATDNGTPPKSSTATVTLTLGYAPKFTDTSNSSDVIYLCETSIGGDELIKLQASDTDTPIANLIFSMDDSPTQTKNLFEIVGDRLKVKSSVANGTFDYEKPNAALLYNISLKVSDGTFSSILNTQIVLEDFNDNPPVFQNTPYTKSIPEATTPGSSVFQVSATDADKTSPNNVVTFILSGTNDFIINSASGVISVAAGVTLNYGTTPSYSLTVKAIDGGGIDNLTATALVTLNISTKPTFDNLASPRNVSVDENVPAGTTVFTLTVTDRDNTGPLSFFIKTQSVSGAFVLNGKVLQTATSIDKETLSSYTISFNVSDGTYSVDSALLTVNVNDVNEKPTFSSVPNIPVKLLESTVAGTQVFKVSASDPDMSAPKNVITFSLSGSGSSDFSIGASSGVVSVASGVTLNYTRQPSYQLVITAMDGGTPSLSSSSTVTVSILTKPTFDNLASPRSVSVDENVPIGSSVLTVTVSDTDNSGALNIFIKTQSVNGAFFLNGNVLQTATSIDKEALSSYTISFNVTDGTYSVDSAVLTVNVNDVNEKPTIFVPNSQVKLLESTVEGSQVFSVSASDPDMSAPNNVITFSLSGSGSSDFSIGASTGVVSVASGVTLNYTRQPSYQIVITAKDGGTPTLSSTSTVTVSILTKPTFDNLGSSNTASVDENVPIGSSVFTVTVSDRDNSGVLTLSIKTQSVNGAFALNGNVLQTATSIDKEALSSYTISFSMTDGTYSVDSAILTVNVNDVNEKPTIFVPNSQVKLLESTVAGSQVFNVSASDPDISAPNNVITFSLSGSGSSDFSIGASSGVLSVASGVTLNYTRQPSYQLVITAKDGGTPTLSSTSTVTVSILTKPTFDNLGSSNTASVDENVPIGSSVFTVTVSDRDNSGVLTLSIKTQSVNGAFALNGNVLQTATSIDKEALSSYTISFSVTDGTYSVDSALLTINVNDVNEKPTISVPNSPLKLVESTVAGSQVFNVSASDPDMSAPNNVITFSLSGSGSSDFSIGSSSGVVSVVSGVTLNYTRQASYQLVITAKDGGTPSLGWSSAVNVSLFTKPTFENLGSPISVSVDENVPIGSSVFTVSVSDRDNSGALNFFIKTQSVSGAFVLNGSVLQTAKNIDRETLSSYTILFNASDGTYIVDSALLTVNVNDVNEKPVISVPNSPVKPLESTVAGTQVFNVSASDPDMSAPNNVIEFAFLGSSDFSIGANSGVVSVASGVTLNYTRQPSYQLVIIAMDGGTPSLSSSATVTVSILTKPTFNTLTSPNNILIDENVPIGTSVFTVAVSDEDNSSGTLQPVIKSQSVNGAFVLNGSILQTAKNIDRETLSSYTISFNVTDGMFTTESATLSITVNDLNDNPPLISPLPDIIKVGKNKAEKEVYYIRANDGDATATNNVFKYSIIDGNSDGYFSLNESSGLLQLVKFPNSAETDTQSLKVKVVDGGTPQLSSTVSVSVEFIGSLIERKVQMIVNGTCPDLTNPSEYTRIQNNIIKMLKNKLKIEAVIVFNIRCGSISFDSRILTNDTESAKTALAEGLQQIASGVALSFGSEYVTARNITVNENTISRNPWVCEVFITINPCGSDHQCSYENGAASCKLVKTLNTDLIIGLCIGLILPLLAALIMIIVAVCCSRRRRRHKSKRSSSLNGSIEPRREKFRGHRWQGDFHMPAMVGYNNHAFTNGVNGFHTRAGQSKRDYYGISSI